MHKESFLRRFGKVVKGTQIPQNERIVEMGLEGAVVVGLGIIATNGDKDRVLYTYTPKSETHNKDLPEFSQAVYRLENYDQALESVRTATANLNSDFHSAYRHSRQVMRSRQVESCSGSGNDRKCHSETEYYYETEYYWRVPQQLESVLGSNDGEVSSWQSAAPRAHSLAGIADKFLITPTVSGMSFDKAEVSVTSRQVGNMVGYVGAGVGFKFMEELGETLLPNVVDADRYVTRRSLLKTLAVVAAGRAAGAVTDATFDHNKALEGDLKRQTAATIAKYREKTPNQIEADFLGASVGTTVARLETVKQRANAVARVIADNPFDSEVQKIALGVHRVLAQIDIAMISINANAVTDGTYMLPPECRVIMQSTLATEEIQSYAAGKTLDVQLSPILGTLVVAGTLFGSGVVIEGINYAQDTLSQRRSV